MTPQSSAISAPSSPHTKQCATIRSLTLPTKPNLDIPHSPAGSPIPGADQKLSHFLKLKEQNTHFNTKLASSSALKNPSLLSKLMDFAGVGSEKQYTTTLPTELWDPVGYPIWAYKKELAEAQHSLSIEKEEERVRMLRESVDYVAAGILGESIGPKRSKTNAVKRVMAVLDRDRKSSPQLNAGRVQSELEKRDRTSEGSPAGALSNLSRRRKRSHSR